MPDKRTLASVRKDKREGKSPGTQAGEFIKEEIHHIREGKHGARSTEQAIAIGLSKARRAGIKLPPPGPGTSDETKRQAKRDTEFAHEGKHPSPARGRAMLQEASWIWKDRGVEEVPLTPRTIRRRTSLESVAITISGEGRLHEEAQRLA